MGAGASSSGVASWAPGLGPSRSGRAGNPTRSTASVILALQSALIRSAWACVSRPDFTSAARFFSTWASSWSISDALLMPLVAATSASDLVSPIAVRICSTDMPRTVDASSSKP
jgi:hypothetical protein